MLYFSLVSQDGVVGEKASVNDTAAAGGRCGDRLDSPAARLSGKRSGDSKLLCKCTVAISTVAVVSVCVFSQRLRRFLQLLVPEADPNCPPHPIPVPLPSPLPANIQDSFTSLEKLIDASLNTTSIVSFNMVL